jgi:hypothetical protein
VRTIGGERLETEVVAVILGVETHLDFHVGLWAWTIWGQAPGQAPGRVERANDREGLAEAPPLSTGRRISALCKEARSSNTGIRSEAHRGGQQQARDHPLAA